MRNITRNFVGRDEDEEVEDEDSDDDDVAEANAAEANAGAGGGSLAAAAMAAAASALDVDIVGSKADGGGGGAGEDGGGEAALDEEEDDEEYNMTQDEVVRARSCELLAEVLRIVPARIDILSRVLGEHFPHKTVEKRVQANYIAGLFAFANSHPTGLVGVVIPLVLEHLIQIDVQIDDSVLEAAVGGGGGGGGGAAAGGGDGGVSDEEFEDTQFEMEPDDLAGGAAESDGDGSEDDADGTALAVDESELLDDGESPADKLDTLMVLSFQFLQAISNAGNQTAIQTAFESLWAAFSRTILVTYQSRHVQYLLFYFCGLHPQLAEVFLGRLLETALAPTRDLVVRQASIAYVASFVARAQAADMNCTMSCLVALTNWVHNYILQHPGAQASTREHLGFYAVCQATFYILCFRIRDVVESDGGEAFIGTLKLETIVSSRLSPLQVCLKHIAAQFTKTMRNHGILYCAQYIRRTSVAGAWGEGAPPVALGDGAHALRGLEDFFPFDPYELRRSKQYLDGMYREWQGQGGNDGDETDDSEIELEEHPEDSDEDDFLPGSESSGGASSLRAGSFEGGGGGAAAFGGGGARMRPPENEAHRLMKGYAARYAAGGGGAASPLNIPVMKRSRSNSGSRRPVIGGSGGSGSASNERGFWGTPLSPAQGISRVRKAAP